MAKKKYTTTELKKRQSGQRKAWVKKHPGCMQFYQQRYRDIWDFFLSFFSMKECFKCGYATCSEALDYHHVESGSKIKDKMYKLFCLMPTQERLKQLDAVVPLCKNCHAELHYNLRTGVTA